MLRKLWWKVWVRYWRLRGLDDGAIYLLGVFQTARHMGRSGVDLFNTCLMIEEECFRPIIILGYEGQISQKEFIRQLKLHS